MEDIKVPYKISLFKFLQGSSYHFGIEFLVLISLPLVCGIMYLGNKLYPSILTLILIAGYAVLLIIILISLVLRTAYWRAFISPLEDRFFLISEQGIFLEDKFGAREIIWKEVTGYKEKEDIVVFTVEDGTPLIINLRPVLASKRYGDLRKLIKRNRIIISDEFDS
jgi:hypothetical protein